MEPITVSNVCVFVVFWLLIIACLAYCILKLVPKLRPPVHPVTTHPVVPEWLETSENIFQEMNCIPEGVDIKIQLRYCERKRKVPRHRKVRLDKKLFAIEKVQKLVDERFGTGTVILPANTCTVSIPMENFQCGGSCVEFVPTNEDVTDDNYTYQMFGDHRIQVAKYKDQIAGYCVYIQDPYDYSTFYKRNMIQKILAEDSKRLLMSL